jgi:hypothetical protein
MTSLRTLLPLAFTLLLTLRVSHASSDDDPPGAGGQTKTEAKTSDRR